MSSPNVTTFIPRECCTAALPIIIDVTTPVPNKVNEGVGEDALPPIGTIPPVETSPLTVSQRHERIHGYGSMGSMKEHKQRPGVFLGC